MQQNTFARGSRRLALALIGAVATLGAAHAGNTDTAVIEMKANGADQRIEVDMTALAEGESRQLSADSGLPAIVTRTAEGLRVEIAGEVREIRMPKIEHLHLGGDGDGDKRVVIKRVHAKDGDASEQRHEVRVIRHAGGGELDEAEIEALVEEAMEHAGHEGSVDGDKVRVIRRVEKRDGQ